MGILSREQILAAPNGRTKDVPVPEWGGEVRIQQLSMSDLEVVNSFVGSDSGKMLVAVALSVVDEEGKPMFTQVDVEALGHKNIDAMKLLADEVAKLNDWDKAINGATEKNSESGPTDASSSS